MKTKKLLYILPIAALVACEPEFDDVDFNGGSADFTRTVAVGNSLTAGFQSSALRRDKQEVSLPAMLAEQFQQVGGGEFKQPLMDEGVGLGSSGNAEFGIFLNADCRGTVGPSPAPIAAAGQTDQILNPSTYVGANGPFNNVGVPGAKSFHLVAPGYGNPAGLLASPATANPYYVRFANPANFDETMLQAAIRANPTFFTLWIGNNDVLGYGTTGGDEGSDAVTDPAVFAGVYTQIVNALVANGAKGAVANIPDITSIPYFTTVKWNALEIDEASATLLNGAYAAYNAGLDQVVSQNAAFQAEADRRKMSFSAGANGLVIVDNTLTDLSGSGLPSIRQITASELVTLVTPGDSIRCAGWGSQTPIPGNFTLVDSEIASIRDAVASYNMTIKSVADANGLAFVDANARLNELATTGIVESGISFTDGFISGGAFSLDGVHPATRGYAIIANDFIDAINAKYGANVPSLDVSSYPAFEIEK